MDLPCCVCGDPVSVLPSQEPRCPLCEGMPLPNRFIATDPRLTDAEFEAWHRGADRPEYAHFYALHAAVETTRAEWLRWNGLADRNRVKTTADWHLHARAKDEYEAALLTMAEFCERMEVSHA